MRPRVKILLLLFSLALFSPCGGGTYEMNLPPDVRAAVLYAPQPDYPRALYERGVRGRGIYRLTIDPKTGTVSEVKVLKHARYAILDEFAAKAFLQWKFRPGTINQTTIEFEFSVTGYATQPH